MNELRNIHDRLCKHARDPKARVYPDGYGEYISMCTCGAWLYYCRGDKAWELLYGDIVSGFIAMFPELYPILKKYYEEKPYDNMAPWSDVERMLPVGVRDAMSTCKVKEITPDTRQIGKPQAEYELCKESKS